MTPSTGWPATTASTAATATTPSPAARRTTCCTGRAATTASSARTATTVSPAAAARTTSPAETTNDQLIGGVAFTGTQDASSDTLAGGNGDDELWGDNYSIGGATQGGADVLLGDAGNDEAHGGPGNDRVEGGTGTDELHGDEGDDLVRGGAGNDVVRGEAGNDILLGDADRDDIVGDLGRDILIGGTGVDGLQGSSGDDILISGTTNFDANDRALAAIRAEWTSARSYLNRTKNLPRHERPHVRHATEWQHLPDRPGRQLNRLLRRRGKYSQRPSRRRLVLPLAARRHRCRGR